MATDVVECCALAREVALRLAGALTNASPATSPAESDAHADGKARVQKLVSRRVVNCYDRHIVPTPKHCLHDKSFQAALEPRTKTW